jgi:hypothetical protein
MMMSAGWSGLMASSPAGSSLSAGKSFEIECDEVVGLTIDGGVRDGFVGGIRQTEDEPFRRCDGFDGGAGENCDEAVDFVGGLAVADEGSAGFFEGVVTPDDGDDFGFVES